MSHIIGSKCVSTCDTGCLEVCPVDCIHGPINVDGMGEEVEELRRENKLGGLQLYIDPEECIDCGACIPECPPEAIFESEDEAIEMGEKKYIEKNYKFFGVEVPEEYK